MCVHWYLVKHFLELSYHFFSKSEGRIFNELRVSFKFWSFFKKFLKFSLNPKGSSQDNILVLALLSILLKSLESIIWIIIISIVSFGCNFIRSAHYSTFGTLRYLCDGVFEVSLVLPQISNAVIFKDFFPVIIWKKTNHMLITFFILLLIVSFFRHILDVIWIFNKCVWKITWICT